METKVGIDRINLYIPPLYLDMRDLAVARDVDPDKFTIGLGQSLMAITDATQDIVVLGANAAAPIVEEEDRDLIDQIIFATESSFDYSKAASTYIHELLEIQPYAKSFEVKEACYAGTAAIQMAADYVRIRPDRKVLVIMSDIARYGLNSGGESTQGAGAIAVMITANPSIMTLEVDSISYTNNQYDFWRPQYSDYPIVEGKYSTLLYQNTFVSVMKELEETKPEAFKELQAMYFHLPFTKMGTKAIHAYRKKVKRYPEDQEEKIAAINKALDLWDEHYEASTILNRNVGNIYTGSLYLSFLSALMNDDSLKAGDKVGLFSYGSGAVAELLLGNLQEGYQKAVAKEDILSMFKSRTSLSVADYETLFAKTLNQEDELVEYDATVAAGEFYLEKIDNHRRYYKRNN